MDLKLHNPDIKKYMLVHLVFHRLEDFFFYVKDLERSLRPHTESATTVIGRCVCDVMIWLYLCAGDLPFPCLAAYGSSKAALNLFMNTLRHELQPWGVSVSTILPSSYKTGNTSKAGGGDMTVKTAPPPSHPSLPCPPPLSCVVV